MRYYILYYITLCFEEKFSSDRTFSSNLKEKHVVTLLYNDLFKWLEE